jgi:purine-nucleoside phosphorylase
MIPIARINESLAFIREKIEQVPRIGLILGSGLGVLAEAIENPICFSYQDIPHFPVATVEGHRGELIFGQLGSQPVVTMGGRFHLYEGYPASTVALPIRVMKQLGVEIVIITNAAGGVNQSYVPGDLMLICDHINLMFQNPLIGPNQEEFGLRFPDMSRAYCVQLRDQAKEIAAQQGIQLREGVYTAVMGPSYETPAEIRMIRKMGGDAVGMSTVPEVIVARHGGMQVMGISIITDACLPDALEEADIATIIATAGRAEPHLTRLVEGVVARL